MSTDVASTDNFSFTQLWKTLQTPAWDNAPASLSKAAVGGIGFALLALLVVGFVAHRLGWLRLGAETSGPANAGGNERRKQQKRQGNSPTNAQVETYLAGAGGKESKVEKDASAADRPISTTTTTAPAVADMAASATPPHSSRDRAANGAKNDGQPSSTIHCRPHTRSKNLSGFPVSIMLNSGGEEKRVAVWIHAHQVGGGESYTVHSSARSRNATRTLTHCH